MLDQPHRVQLIFGGCARRCPTCRIACTCLFFSQILDPPQSVMIGNRYKSLLSLRLGDRNIEVQVSHCMATSNICRSSSLLFNYNPTL
jgi:hypothetical protein